MSEKIKIGYGKPTDENHRLKPEVIKEINRKISDLFAKAEEQMPKREDNNK